MKPFESSSRCPTEEMKPTGLGNGSLQILSGGIRQPELRTPDDESFLAGLPIEGIKVEDLTPSLPPEYLHDVVQYVRDQQIHKHRGGNLPCRERTTSPSEGCNLQGWYESAELSKRLQDVEEELDEICWVFTPDWQTVNSCLKRPNSGHDYWSECSSDAWSEFDSSTGSESTSFNSPNCCDILPRYNESSIYSLQNNGSNTLAVSNKDYTSDRWPTITETLSRSDGTLTSGGIEYQGGLPPRVSFNVSSSGENRHCGQNGWWRAACASVPLSSALLEITSRPSDGIQETPEDSCMKLKRPKNGFIRFAMAHRREVAAEHPHMDNREISRILGIKWRKLSHEEKLVFENEFQREMEERKKCFPSWNYGARRKTVDSTSWEPIPSRLRPREKLKRKHIPRLTRPYVRRETAAPPVPVPWVQCDRCDKWRQLPPWVDVANIAGEWFCEYNFPPRNHCDAEEEGEEEKKKQQLDEDLLSSFDFDAIPLLDSQLARDVLPLSNHTDLTQS